MISNLDAWKMAIRLPVALFVHEFHADQWRRAREFNKSYRRRFGKDPEPLLPLVLRAIKEHGTLRDTREVVIFKPRAPDPKDVDTLTAEVFLRPLFIGEVETKKPT